MHTVFEFAFGSRIVAKYFLPPFLQVQKLRPAHPLFLQVLQSIFKDVSEDGRYFLSLSEVRAGVLHDLKKEATHINCFPWLFLEVELEHHDS